MKYRPEIDGLRAIAVLPVILFHAGFTAFSGGYLGVDIFFVISGYLITTIIASELKQANFSLLGFYERRARRILPALFFMVAVTIPMAWYWLLPNDFDSFTNSLIGVSTFSSNVFFWLESGYWEIAAEEKPLLHTWSLAIEEQFYVFFPLLLMFIWKRGVRFAFLIVVLIVISSLILSQWGAQNRPSAAFYLLPTRIWELGIGSTIALYLLAFTNTNNLHHTNKILAESLSLIGLGMMLYAIVTFDKHTPHPGVYSLIPTIGAGLVILYSSTTIVGWFLSRKVVVGIGLISYSAYLWHYPMLAYAKQISLTRPDQFTNGMLALVTLIPAYLSWRYIEKPFRNRSKFSRNQIFKYSVISATIILGFGIYGNIFGNSITASAEHKSREIKLNEKLEFNDGLSKHCIVGFTLSPQCRTDDQPDVMIWGDSFAMHLVPGIIASSPDTKLIQMTKYSCGPFFDVAPFPGPPSSNTWANKCLEFSTQLKNWLETNSSIKFVILSFEFTRFIDRQNHFLYTDGTTKQITNEEAVKQFNATLNHLKQLNIKPIIVAPPPTNGENLGKCLLKAAWREEPLSQCDYRFDEIEQATNDTYRFLNQFTQDNSVIFPHKTLCDKSWCRSHINDSFIYIDDKHLSIDGSKLFGEKIQEPLQKSG